jgi:hypothetical protein
VNRFALSRRLGTAALIGLLWAPPGAIAATTTVPAPEPTASPQPAHRHRIGELPPDQHHHWYQPVESFLWVMTAIYLGVRGDAAVRISSDNVDFEAGQVDGGKKRP